MKITGVVKDKDGTLPSANIYVSDKDGKLLLPSRGTASNVMDGSYSLDGVNLDNYITASYVGYNKVTKKASDIGSGSTVKYDFILGNTGVGGLGVDIPIFELIDEAPLKLLVIKKNNNKPLIYAGIGLGVMLIGFVMYKFIK